MTACITGWAHARFGRLDGEDSESLIVRVVREAIADANLEAEAIDAIYLGTFFNDRFNGGGSFQFTLNLLDFRGS